MIRYTVLWRENVEGELAAIWSDWPNRQEITVAADRIDAELGVDAHLKGISFPHGARALPISPLVAFYRVSEADRKTFVEAIRLIVEN